jgi:hypothetical protein
MLHAVRRHGLRLAHFPRPLHVADGRPCRYQPVIAGAVSVRRPFVGRGLKKDLDAVFPADPDAYFQEMAPSCSLSSSFLAPLDPCPERRRSGCFVVSWPERARVSTRRPFRLQGAREAADVGAEARGAYSGRAGAWRGIRPPNRHYHRSRRRWRAVSRGDTPFVDPGGARWLAARAGGSPALRC